MLFNPCTRICVLFFFFCIGTSLSECPEGWIHFDKSCYLFSTEKINWYNAQSSCRSHNGRLAEVTSREQQVYLRNMSRSYGRNYWLGGRDDVIEGKWVWSNTDKPLTVTDWYPGEPDNINNQDCLLIWATYDWHWGSGGCTAELYYICEKEYPGETDIVG